LDDALAVILRYIPNLVILADEHVEGVEVRHILCNRNVVQRNHLLAIYQWFQCSQRKTALNIGIPLKRPS